MVPVSHALDLKASNPKTAATPSAPAKTGFQALIERLAHHLEAEKPVKASLAPKPEAAHAERKTEKTAKHEAERLEKTAAEKGDKRDDPTGGANANALAAAVFMVKPEALRQSEAQNASVQAKAIRERDVKPAGAEGAAQQALLGLKPVPALKHAEHAGEEKPKVTVVDRRTETKEKEKAKSESAAQALVQPVPVPVPEVAAKSDATTSVAEAKVVFHPTDHGTPFDIKPQNAMPAARDAATFQQYLVDKGYGQLVDQARIVLRDNNAGEIRMTLHPESLGKVKVALNLSDGSLAGKIFVENQTVKDVFQANMDGLMQAFRDGGWTDLSLQVSVGGEQKRNGDSAPAPARDYGRQVTAVSSETPETVHIGAWTDRQINLTA